MSAYSGIDMADTNDSLKLFRYLEQRFDELGESIAKKADDEKVDRVLTILDGFAERFDIDDEERAALVSQVDRQEDKLSALDSRVTTLEEQTA